MKSAAPVSVSASSPVRGIGSPRFSTLILIVLALAYYGYGAYEAISVIRHSTSSFRAREKVYSHRDFKGSMDLKLNLNSPLHSSLLRSLVRRELGLSSENGAAKESHALESLESYADSENILALHSAWSLALASILFIVLVAATSPHRGPGALSILVSRVLWQVLCVSIVMLTVGLFAPMVTLLTKPKVPLLDEVVVQYQARSIVSAISALFASGNWVVASLITTFSVTTPLAKTTAMFVAMRSHSADLRRKITWFLAMIGKWSMADVFVVAVVLACFALKADKATVASPGIGLYYFASYCILSLTIGHWVGDFARETKKPDRPWWQIAVAAIVAIGFCALFACLWVIATGKKTDDPRLIRYLHLPTELRNSTETLVDPAFEGIPFTVPYAGILTVDVDVTGDRGVTAYVIPPDQIDIAKAGKNFEQITDFELPEVKKGNRSAEIAAGEYYLFLHGMPSGVFKTGAPLKVAIKITVEP